MDNFTTTFGNSVANSAPQTRASFIRKTYLHLAGAIFAFIALEVFFFTSDIAGVLFNLMTQKNAWFVVLALFMGASFLANWWANSSTSKPLQYLGLALYVVVQAVIFVPLLGLALYYSGDGAIIAKAGIVTLGLFAGLTATVFLTRTDFSFLGPVLMIGGFVALGVILASMLFGFNLGSLFAFIMVAFAGSAILYDTSNVMRRYHETQYVAASLALFASVALLFWYILSIFTRRD